MLTPETEDLPVVGYDTQERFDHRPVKIVPTDAPMDDFIIEVKSRPGYIGGHGPVKLPVQPMAEYDEDSWSILESIKRKGKDYYIIQFKDNKAARRYIKHYEAFEWVSPAVLEEWEYYEFKKIQKTLAQEEEEAEAEEKLKKAKRAERRRPRNRPRIIDSEDVDNDEDALEPGPSVKKERSASNRDTVKPPAVPTLTPSRASKQPTLVQPLTHVFSGTSAKRNITQMSSREDTPLAGTSEQAVETSEDDGPAPKRRLFEVRIPTPGRNVISNLQSSSGKREKSTSSNIQERSDSQIYEEMPKSKVVVELSFEESSEEDIAERKKVTESASLTKTERATERPVPAARRFSSPSRESANLTKPSNDEKSRLRDVKPVSVPQKNLTKEQWIADHFLDGRKGPVDKNGTRPQQLLVKWRGRPEATWEPADAFPESMVSDFRNKAEEKKKADKKRASSSTSTSVARKKAKTFESDDDDNEILFEASPGGQDAERSVRDDGGPTSMSPVKPTFPEKFYGSSIRSAPPGQGLPPKAQRPVRFSSESADAVSAPPASAKKRAPSEPHIFKSILDHKTKAKKKPAVTMFLVEWEGFGQPTWEPQTNLPKHAVRQYFDSLAGNPFDKAHKTASSDAEGSKSARKMPVRPALDGGSNMAMPPPAVPRSARKMPVTSAAYEAPRSSRKMPALIVKRSVDTSADSDFDHSSSATPDVPQRASKKPVTSAASRSVPRARKMPATPSADPVMDGFNLPVVPSPSASSNNISRHRERSEGQSSSSKKKGIGLISKTPIKRATVQTKLNFFGANSKATPNKNSILSLSPARKLQPTPPQPQRRESFQADDLDFTWGSESGSPGQKMDAPSSQAKSGYAGNNSNTEESEDEIGIMPKPMARKTPVKPTFGWEDDDDEDEFMRN